MEHLSLWELW